MKNTNLTQLVDLTFGCFEFEDKAVEKFKTLVNIVVAIYEKQLELYHLRGPEQAPRPSYLTY